MSAIGRCPGCRSELRERISRGLLIDGCAQCGGRWFDRTEIDTWLRRAGTACADADSWRCEVLAEDHRRCPRCATWTLQAYRCGDLRCLRCTCCRGVFAQTGELTRLQVLGGSPTRRDGAGRWWRLLRLLLRPRPNWRSLLERLT
jgi:Zn-finger nucleic acid-binding protein